tara:strand:- start:975 stop:1076 length:102 start_codon:yes stop_codon:yes gene_type:complete
MKCKDCEKSLVDYISHKGLCYECFIQLGDKNEN